MDNTKFNGIKNFEEKKEFEKYYEELWNLTPHYYSNWPTPEEMENQKKKFSKIFNDDKNQKFDNEKWEYLPCNTHYEVSSLGRIKYDKQFIKQNDSYKDGYLTLVQPENFPKIDTSTYVYTFVAKTFLGKKDGDGLHVHHLDNNGYDCSIENLVLLTPQQHRAVHRNRLLNKVELEDFLKPQKRYSEDKIKLHLSDYKINKIIQECGKWNNGKFYSHILPNEKDNLINVSYKEQFEELYNQKKAHIHQYFSHLTSSQALCFNLFYPLVLENKLDVIDPACKESSNENFEYIDQDSFEKMKSEKEKTNFDFFFISNNKKYFFEVKYTEETFGYVSSFKPNDKHDKKYQSYYKSQLSEISSSDNEVTEKEFFDNYQLWRNICHVYDCKTNKINEVYFVYLKDRTDLEQDVKDAIKKCKPEYKKHIHFLTIEKIVKDALSVNNEKLHNHYLEFFDKYLDY